LRGAKPGIAKFASGQVTIADPSFGTREVQTFTERMTPMDSFAHSPEVRARIECAEYFWRGVFSLFSRRA